MQPKPRPTPKRVLETLGLTLVQQSSRLTRTVYRTARPPMSRTESSVLATLADNGPQRISSLAEIEGLAQPTVTLLVRRLEDRDWVERQRFAEDGRVVLVSLTESGRDALEAVRSHYRMLVRDALDSLTGDQVEALRKASGALEALMDALQREDQL